MKKVLQVIDRLEIGGAERVFLDLSKLLLDKGVVVDALTISARGVLFESIDVRAGRIFLNRNNKYSLLKMLECASICAGYEIVHVHTTHTYFYVRLSQIVSFRKFKIIFHAHFGEFGNDKKIPFSLNYIFKPLFFIGVSSSLCTWAVHTLKIKSQHVWLLRNIIIPFASENIKIDDAQEKKWVLVSNIRKVKNIELAISLAESHHMNLHIYGQLQTDEYSKKIQTSIENKPYIELIQTETNVQSKLNNYALALHVSVSEAGPLVLLEYLAQGLPFLAHYTGEVAEVLHDEIPECFVHSLNIDDWQNAIKRITENPPSSEKLISLFNKYFGPEEYVNKCLKIYQEVGNY